MIQLTNIRFALVTILAFGGAIFSDTKTSVGIIDMKSPKANSPESIPAGISKNDWSSIREAYDAGRHVAYSVDGGYRFRNPGQQWNTQFDGRGFLVKPDSDDWSWGLELQSYGVAGDEQPVSKTSNISAEGQLVLYQWDSNLTEWYRNDRRGLEHGFTIKKRPVGSKGFLTFTLEVRGTLRSSLQSTGRDIAFMNKDGANVLNYSGLLVFDSDGDKLPSHFESCNSGVRIVVDDAGADYPLTVDPVAQQAYLKASNTDSEDRFGFAVAVSGDTAVISAPYEDSSSIGVNGNSTNNSALDSGAAYVFVRNGGLWTQQAYLKASNTESGDLFGWSVGISGDTVAVGAIWEDSNASGVNGDQSNNSIDEAGAVYVFIRNGTNWTQQAYLKSSNPGSPDRFGASVSVFGDTLVVGANQEDGGIGGVNGNDSDDSVGRSGAAYVFVRSGSTWTQQAYLKASHPGVADSFGFRVSVHGDTIAVNSPYDDSSASGINGNANNDDRSDSGALFVFVRSGTTWSQQAYLKASNPDVGDTFGYGFSLSGDTIAVGATFEDSSATGVNGNQSDNSALDSGAVYIFQRTGTTWSQQAYLKASNTEAGDDFGSDIAISGDILAVGAPLENGGGAGVSADQSDNTLDNAGAVYVFTRSGNNWSQIAYLKASNPDAFDGFGGYLGLSGDLLVVSSLLEDALATGVNGNGNNNSAPDSGSAYAFDLGIDPGTSSYGTGTPGCAGVQTLGVTHAPMINSPHFTLTCSNAPPLSIGLGIVSDSQDLAGTDVFGVGVLVHSDLIFATEILTFDFFSNNIGYSETVNASIPNNPLLIGLTFYASALWAWPTFNCVLPGFNPYNLSTSRGLAITILVP